MISKYQESVATSKYQESSSPLPPLIIIHINLSPRPGFLVKSTHFSSPHTSSSSSEQYLNNWFLHSHPNCFSYFNQNNTFETTKLCKSSHCFNGDAVYCRNEKVRVKVTQSCLTLCESMDYTVHGVLQARILEWVAIPFSRGSSQPRDRTQGPRIAGRFFTSWATREALCCNKQTKES